MPKIEPSIILKLTEAEAALLLAQLTSVPVSPALRHLPIEEHRVVHRWSSPSTFIYSELDLSHPAARDRYEETVHSVFQKLRAAVFPQPVDGPDPRD